MRRVPVEVAAVAVRAVTYAITTVGSLEADEVIRVPARVAGVVEQIAFHEGTSVGPKTVLARIDPERYRLAAQRAEANLQQSEAHAREVQAALDKRRALRAKDAGWVTEEELNNWTAQLDQALASSAAARAALDLARRDMADSEVRAETSGIINEKLVDTGQYVSAGAPIATMVDTHRLKLAFKVAESESVRVSNDSRVTFSIQALPGKTFSAKPYHIAKAADPTTRMVAVLAWVENPTREIRPGFFADVSIEVDRHEGAIVVPQTAVIPTDQGFIGYVVKGEDQVEPRSLRLGLFAKDGSVEVLEGLAPGDRVVVRGAAALNPDSRIQLVEGAGL